MDGKLSPGRDIFALKNENNLIITVDQEKSEMFANFFSKIFIAGGDNIAVFQIR